jgi:hypothetical protein
MRKANKKGFMAVTAVILLATGTLAFSLVALASAAAYADAVMRRELRVQAGLNAEACLDTAALMAAKDYFFQGDVNISEFGCTAHVVRAGPSDIQISATAILAGVTVQGSRTVQVAY